MKLGRESRMRRVADMFLNSGKYRIRGSENAAVTTHFDPKDWTRATFYWKLIFFAPQRRQMLAKIKAVSLKIAHLIFIHYITNFTNLLCYYSWMSHSIQVSGYCPQVFLPSMEISCQDKYLKLMKVKD